MTRLILIISLLVVGLSSSFAEDEENLDSLLSDEIKAADNLINESNESNASFDKTSKVSINFLDKVSTKITTESYNLMSRNRYKQFEVIVFNCLKPKQKMDNHRMLIGIWEHKEKQDMEKIFVGWLFSVDKNLSQIEHRFLNIANFKCVD